MSRKKIGIALSGGAARGFAHIGVLKALNEAGIFPDIISGTSAGAVIGAYYADGKSPDEILEIFKGIRIFDLLKVGVPRGGIMSMENVKKFLSDNLRARTFEELKLPFYVNTVNLNKGENVFFHSGSLIDKICASCALPFIYMPVQLEEDLYVDGGLLVNLPVDPLIKNCDFIIGVNLNPTTERIHFPSLHSVLIRSYHLTIRNNIKQRKSMCDLFLDVKPIENHSHFDISKGNEMYTLGYNYARKILNKTGISEVLAKAN